MSEVNYELKILSVIFYTICPTLGIGFGVAYFFSRNQSLVDIRQLAEKVEEYVITPDELEGKVD